MKEIEGLLFIGFITFFILLVIRQVRREEKNVTTTKPKDTKDHE